MEDRAILIRVVRSSHAGESIIRKPGDKFLIIGQRKQSDFSDRIIYRVQFPDGGYASLDSDDFQLEE